MSLHSHDMDLFAPRRIDEQRTKKKRSASKPKALKRRKPIDTSLFDDLACGRRCEEGTAVCGPHFLGGHAAALVNGCKEMQSATRKRSCSLLLYLAIQHNLDFFLGLKSLSESAAGTTIEKYVLKQVAFHCLAFYQ